MSSGAAIAVGSGTGSENPKFWGIYLRLRLEPKLKSSPKLPTLALFLFPLQFQKPKDFYAKIWLCVIGVGFMIWELDFVAFDEHAMLDVFRRLWGLRRTPLVASRMLRRTLDPFGSLSVKTPPPGCIFR